MMANTFFQQVPPVTVGPKRLAVVTCYFNPVGFRALRENYIRFCNDMRAFGVPLFAAEAAFEGQPFVDPCAFLKLHAGPEHVLWQKEQLLNLLVERLPAQFDAVAWIDADVLFFDRDWPAKTLEALAHFPVVQLWNRWHFTNADGQIFYIGDNVGHLGHRIRKDHGHPGGAWACRRSVFPLDAYHILGGGDTTCVEAWLAMPDTFAQKQMTPGRYAQWKRWAIEAERKVRGRITCLKGEAVHLYHGSRPNRKYGERQRWLLEHNYDPDQHVRVDQQGLLAWTEAAPEGLKKVVYDYFFQVRNEDEGLKPTS